MSRLPTLFVSHGAPTLALAPGAPGRVWHELALALPRPQAVLVVSAHTMAGETRLGSAERHHTVHDFRGFPEPLYRLRYDAPGAPDLARRLAEGLRAADWPVLLDEAGGLDHGAWVPLREMYPQADVPVVPLSIDPRRDAAWHYRLGRTLAPLLEDDVLLLASGSLTHNLGHFSPGWQGEPPAYVTAFQDWLYRRLSAGDVEALLDYRARAPGARESHPTDEHLLPLFVALGAAGEKAGARRHLELVLDRALAMDVYSFAA